MMCFIRINPSSAPLNPPGAAPTLTTIYQTATNSQIPSEFKSQSSTNSSQRTTTSTSEKTTSKRKRRFGKPDPASVGIEGTEKEKRRMQGIADSLDLGLEVEEGRKKAEGKLKGAENARGEPNRVVGRGDVRLERRRESVGVILPVGKRRSVG